MDNRLQTKVLALAMQIIGIKDPGQFKQAMTMMSEGGRNKFLAKCAEIIQSGDTSEENIAQAQQFAQQAIQEGEQGQQAILARHGNRVTYLNRFYSGGSVKTFDGGYMKLKKPLNKNQVEGRESIGLYKGQWMYLNGDHIAVPNQNGKQKGDDGSTHINRAYNGMLIPKPQRYSLGGIFSSIGNWVKGAGQTIGRAYGAADNWINKNQEYITGGASTLAGILKTIKGMNRSNRYDGTKATGDIQDGYFLINSGINPFIKMIQDSHNYRAEQAKNNGAPGSQLNQEFTPEGMIKDPYSGKLLPQNSPEGLQAIQRTLSNTPEHPFEQYSNLQIPDNSNLQNLQFDLQNSFLK